jgi:hypothetical protein
MTTPASPVRLPGFEYRRIDVEGITINCAVAGRGYEPLSAWQQYATNVRGAALPTGHFLPEEAPDLVTAALRDFLN